MKQTKTSIQTKLMRLVLGTSSVVMFLTCAAFFVYESYSFRNTTRENLRTLGKIISVNSTAAIAFQNPEDAMEILEALKVEKHIVAAALYDESGKLFAQYPDTISTSLLPVHPGKDEYRFANSNIEGYEPVIQGGTRLGTLFIRSDMKAIQARFWTYSMLAAFVFFISIGIAYLLSLRLQRRVSEPIRALAKTAANVSETKDYTVRANKFDNDELGVLTDAFNEMLQQIETQNAAILSFNEALEEKVIERTNELEKANAELKINSEFIETIVDSSVDMIAVFDAELRYVMMNKYAQNLYQKNKEEIIGKHILELFPKLKNGPMHQNLTRALAGEMIHDSNYASPLTDSVFENYFIPLLNNEGTVYNVLVIGHDITAITQANKKLSLLNDELEKSNKELEQFAYIASHDLQEPLRKIRSFSDMLLQKIDDNTPVRPYIQKIITSSTRMSFLIEAVLNYSRLSNALPLAKYIDLNEIIENIKEDFELAIAEKKAIITYNQLPVIQGDLLQINQLFSNLISNALKFSSTEPVINITASIVEPGSINKLQARLGNTRFVKLIVADNGIGFDQQYSDKIFTIFQRLHTRDQYPGTGIGLALCKKIIDNHYGDISAKSEPGVGTTFTLYLPLQLPDINTLVENVFDNTKSGANI